MRFLKISTFMALSLFSAVLLLGLVSLRAMPGTLGRGAGSIVPTAGDLNCDGSIDIGDAISLLRYIFVDNKDVPCAIAQQGPGFQEVIDQLCPSGNVA
jgi:hypothetical protein